MKVGPSGCRRVLFAYTGSVSTVQRQGGATLFDDLRTLPTTHMSEVNHLLMCHWLREQGHDVSVLVRNVSKDGSYHFPPVPVADADPEAFDTLILFKVHGLKFMADVDVLDRPWKRIIAWQDAPAPDNIIGDHAHKVAAFAWGTPGILAHEKDRWPNARHTVCEHATVFSSPPILGPTVPRGLYAGRMPPAYRDVVIAASNHCPIRAYSLWVSTEPGERILLRPSQITDEGLAEARRRMPEQVDLQPGLNVIANATEVSKAAFGLCPATSPSHKPQILSASKFYDYLALGLPVVLADNTPEAEHVRGNPMFGELYSQGDDASLKAAIERIQDRAEGENFAAHRLAIQAWVFNYATYRHRAGVLHGLI